MDRKETEVIMQFHPLKINCFYLKNITLFYKVRYYYLLSYIIINY